VIARGQNFKKFPLNINGSSTFGRYAKVSVEKTYNMFSSDNWLVPYAGYMTAIPAVSFNNGLVGRALHTSTKLNRMISVIGSGVYLVNISFNQTTFQFVYSVVFLGNLNTSIGVVYIAENNKPQILISDNTDLYLYDPTLTPMFRVVTGLNFTPGFIDFHDTYFLCAASNDETYSPPANNTWRLSAQNDGTMWPSDAAHVGLLQTKPDNTQAVVRFPSRGNAILVFGETVVEPWFDVGYQLFPYQRQTSWNVDYGCLNPATIASTDEIVVWLAANEKSGPIIMYTTGGMPEKITTDGIDYLFSTLNNPADSQGFIYRQDGHLIYHINFYTDNLSLFYDFNTKKFYHASDQNLNYFIAAEIAFFNNQYYFVTKNNGNLYAFDTIFYTYDGAEIPRIRSCKNVRDTNQEYFIANDVGFTIEQGEIPYQQQPLGFIDLITQDGFLIATQDGLNNLISQQMGTTDAGILSLAHVDLSISQDGGVTFSSDFPYYLNPPAQRKNKLIWWQIGIANDLVCQFKFWGLGRFVCTDGEVNVRQ
jgi:hypothetical protein